MTPDEIRTLREALGLSQEGLARRLGLQTRGAVSHWEAGRKAPTGPTLAALGMLAESARKKSRKKPRIPPPDVDSSQQGC